MKMQRDMTDNHLRRSLRALGFRGKNLPMSICDCVTHENRPGEYEVMQQPGERRRDAVVRLKAWAANGEDAK